jgi:Ca2+-binding RTX toxin-like protein
MAKPVRGIVWNGSESDDVFTGTDGADSLGGQGGNDTIDGGAGDDKIYGGVGDDTLAGGLGNDTLMGNEGNDTLLGGDGDDFLYGQEGNDTVNGGAGNDMIGSGPGNDTITGGTGADRFFFASNFEGGTNVHTITDFSSAEGDYIDLKSIDADGNSSNDTRNGNTDFTVVDGPSATPGTAWMEAFTDPITGATGLSIYLNTDADSDADTRIDVLGVSSLTWGANIIG